MLWGMMLLAYQLVELQERCGYHQDTRLARISAPHCGLQQVCVWGGGHKKVEVIWDFIIL